MEIHVTLHFDAAHRLPSLPPGHKCSRLHGHTFLVEVHVAGEPDPTQGWVMDFGEIKAAARPVIDQLDHRLLNEIPGLENPTSENVARWLWERIAPRLPALSRIVVRENPNSGVEYRG
jgi:6-pyruvoyltetrahydropterin/6-carboxytetrahydropterin synthase